MARLFDFAILSRKLEIWHGSECVKGDMVLAAVRNGNFGALLFLCLLSSGFANIADEVLHHAVQKFDNPIPWAKALLAMGARGTYQDQKGRTVLHAALSLKRDGGCIYQSPYQPAVGLLELLLLPGLHIDAKDNSGRTALHIAARYHDPSTVLFLLNHGASVHLRDRGGRTSLHLCPAGGYDKNSVKVAEALIRAGADVNQFDDRGFMPLLMATFHRQHDDLIDHLLLNGAKPLTRRRQRVAKRGSQSSQRSAVLPLDVSSPGFIPGRRRYSTGEAPRLSRNPIHVCLDKKADLSEIRPRLEMGDVEITNPGVASRVDLPFLSTTRTHDVARRRRRGRRYTG